MPIQLHSQKGNELYHRSPEKTPKYSIFGANKMMNFAYIPISNVERNNRGFFTEPQPKDPSYYRKGLIQIKNKEPIDVPVWTLSTEKAAEGKPVIMNNYDNSNNNNNNNNKMNNSTSSRTFVWPYGGNHVVLTGDFDHWKGSIEMTPVNGVFEANVDNLDRSVDIEYKFIVDGKWCFDMKMDNVKDEAGNINNIIYAQE
ncbi:hypothetical protein HMPREF1544_01501 [Mucor circinelloides 1006PhL]|uniref:AMP-activated protein kinase glycogen-binding domain-containing protein n=1 Tax=Mucor circinelloides f. circinelloides (strain 1006PhL) TaxID=1220926 RepID=S2JNP7_MUCC1|nr:hypothetical protein HMPREF1544_01501 [Mucor circinelloides 1006PhL]